MKIGLMMRRAQIKTERVRFELTAPCEATVFKTAAFDHSATSPYNFNYYYQITQKRERCCAGFYNLTIQKSLPTSQPSFQRKAPAV